MNPGNPKNSYSQHLKEVGNNQLYRILSFVTEMKLQNKRLFLTPLQGMGASLLSKSEFLDQLTVTSQIVLL